MEAKGKVKKLVKREQTSLRSNRKRPYSRSSEESGNETVSKRTRQGRQPIEIADEESARDKRKRAREVRARRASIEDMSDEESSDGHGKTLKNKRSKGNQKPSRVSSRLQRIYRQDSDDEMEESKSRKSTRRVRQQKVSSEDDDDDELEPEIQRNAGRRTRGRNRPQISGLSVRFTLFFLTSK